MHLAKVNARLSQACCNLTTLLQGCRNLEISIWEITASHLLNCVQFAAMLIIMIIMACSLPIQIGMRAGQNINSGVEEQARQLPDHAIANHQ